MTEVIMPKMGDGMEEGTLVEWLKADGDAVKSGEVIGNIQTDKATLELEAPASGKFTGILLEAGGTVPVGQPIAAILKAGESLPGSWGGKPAASPAPTAGAPAPGGDAPTGANPASGGEDPSAQPADARSVQSEDLSSAPSSNGSASSGSTPNSSTSVEAPKEPARVVASPLAKRIAAEAGVDLVGLVGTGPGGRIVEKDVRAAETKSKAVSEPAPVPAAAAAAEDQAVNISRLRQITAQRTQQSKQQVPHYYVTVEVDMERILALREMFKSEESGSVSINDFVVKACALALRDLPHVNASFSDNKHVRYGGVHVGMAVALEDGLTVPVIKSADTLTLRQISAKSKDLAKKARDNKLGLDDLQGSTFAISNMGMLDVDNFIAIVNQPNSGILAIASVRKKVVVGENDEIEVRSRMNITGSFDHRVTDGAQGAEFVNRVKAYLESPSRLLT